MENQDGTQSLQSLQIPVDTIWMKSPLLPEGAEKGHDLPSTRKLKTKVRGAAPQPLSTPPAAPLAAPFAAPPAQSVAEEPHMSSQRSVQEDARGQAQEQEINSVHYVARPSMGQTQREKDLEAENATIRAEMAAMRRARVAKESEARPEEAKDDARETPRENLQVGGKGRQSRRNERDEGNEKEENKIWSYAKWAIAAGVGLLLLGGHGGAGAAPVARKSVGSVNDWA